MIKLSKKKWINRYAAQSCSLCKHMKGDKCAYKFIKGESSYTCFQINNKKYWEESADTKAQRIKYGLSTTIR